jgi:hypothetical protein
MGFFFRRSSNIIHLTLGKKPFDVKNPCSSVRFLNIGIILGSGLPIPINIASNLISFFNFSRVKSFVLRPRPVSIYKIYKIFLNDVKLAYVNF